MIMGLKNSFLFLILVSMVFLFAACNGTTGSTNNLSVKAIAANKHTLQTNIDVTGVLVPVQTTNVTAKISGYVNSINVDVGSSVSVGDTLVTIDTKELNVQLQQVKAALKSAENQATQAKINLDAAQSAYNSTKELLADQEAQAKINLDTIEKLYKRNQELAASGSASQSQLDDAKTKYDLAKIQYDMAKIDSGSSAKSQLTAALSKYDLAEKQYEIASGSALEQAQAAVNSVKVQLDNANIVSPINGIVTNKNINTGELASPGAALLTIIDTSTLKLKGTVSQEALPLLKPGQDIDVIVDIYPDTVFKGQIDNIGPMAVGTGAYFPIEISIENTGELKAGLSAHASISISTDNGIIVPFSAVVQNNGQSYVFVIKDNIASKRTVTLGLENDEEIEVLKGLDAGELVAATNVNSLFDNMPVNVD